MNPMLLLHPYALATYAFLFWSGWVFAQGRHFEQNLQMAATKVINDKLEDVNRRETTAFIKGFAERVKAHAEARSTLVQGAKCTVTEDEAIAIARIK